MSKPTETWLPVTGYEGLYEVSDLGRVRSLDRTVITGNGPRHYRGRIRKQDIGDRGYPSVKLSRLGAQANHVVHLLVLTAHVSPCPEGQEALHGPGGKLDARLANLRWGTRSENIRDRTRDGQDNRGERQGRHKLTAADAADIKARWNGGAGERQSDLADEYHITRQNVWAIVHEVTWHYPETSD